ncbi:MAG: SURF1 family protein [Alphaproteobacteria bacterium]|nr:MAG: SURF1 family protein [Alphaproteobacteria bacterium]
MRISFQPLPFLTLTSLLVFGLLIWLGQWQVQRLHWKLDLIAATEEAKSAEPHPLVQLLEKGEVTEYRRVSLEGQFDNSRELYLFTSKGSLGVGFQVITPFQLTDGRWLLVDRGFVPEALKAPTSRAEGQIEGRTRVVGLVRHSIKPGVFTPEPERGTGVWYNRDFAEMAKSLELSPTVDLFIDADQTPNKGGFPLGGQTIVEFTNNHFGYALTWFGMALALLVIYFVFHYRAGRLRFVTKS